MGPWPAPAGGRAIPRLGRYSLANQAAHSRTWQPKKTETVRRFGIMTQVRACKECVELCLRLVLFSLTSGEQQHDLSFKMGSE